MKWIKAGSIIFILLFAAFYIWALDFFLGGFRFKNVYNIPIKTNCVLGRWAIENGKTIDLHNKYININIPTYGLYFADRELTTPKDILPPGVIVSTFKISDGNGIVYSKSEENFHISYFSVSMFNDVKMMWTTKVPELNNIEYFSSESKNKHEFACLDKNNKTVLVYNEDGKMTNSITFNKQIIIASFYIDDDKREVFCSDGETITNLDKTIVLRIPEERAFEDAFFLAPKNEFISNIFCYYDGNSLHGFDVEKKKLIYSKEVSGLKPGIYSDRFACPYRYGLLSINPETGSTSIICCQNQFTGKNEFRALSYFKQSRNTYCLFENKNNGITRMQLFEMNESGFYRLMSNSVFPFTHIYLVEASGLDFYLFTDKGVYATDTFEYFYP